MRIDTEELLLRYQDDVFRAAFVIVGNHSDAEDVSQETFIRYHRSKTEFESESHIKAWLLRTAMNLSKDLLKSFFRKNSVPLEEYAASVPFESPEDSGLFTAVMALPRKYRAVIHLFYYEGYSTNEIAAMLRLSPGNVRMRLSRARDMLRNALSEDGEPVSET